MNISKYSMPLALAAALLCPWETMAAPAAAREEARPVYQDVALPESFSLCGEVMPLKTQSVYEMLDRELTISVWEQAQVFMWLKRAGRAFPLIEKRLEALGMPEDLKYLAVAESSLLPYIESNKGAVGTWQMIQDTGVRNGLRKDELMDQRLSLESATDAALRYLQKLHQEFGSWALALAAYNCGEARVRREIEIQKVTDYYRLNLPLETERFVFRISAIKLIMQNPQRYGYTIPKERLYRPVKADTVEIQLDRPLAIADVALEAGTDFKILKELNPEFTKYEFPAGSYVIKVPKGMASKAKAAVKTLARAQAQPQPNGKEGTDDKTRQK